MAAGRDRGRNFALNRSIPGSWTLAGEVHLSGAQSILPGIGFRFCHQLAGSRHFIYTFSVITRSAYTRHGNAGGLKLK